MNGTYFGLKYIKRNYLLGYLGLKGMVAWGLLVGGSVFLLEGGCSTGQTPLEGPK